MSTFLGMWNLRSLRTTITCPLLHATRGASCCYYLFIRWSDNNLWVDTQGITINQTTHRWYGIFIAKKRHKLHGWLHTSPSHGTQIKYWIFTFTRVLYQQNIIARRETSLLYTWIRNININFSITNTPIINIIAKTFESGFRSLGVIM